MSETSDPGVLREFLESVARDELPPDMRVVIEISEVVPQSGPTDKFEVLSNGKIKSFDRSISSDENGREVMAELTLPERTKLFRLLSRGLDSLPLRSEAGFQPDSEIGSITILMGGREEKRYFLVNPIDRAIQRRPIAAEIEEALEFLKMVPKRLKQDGPNEPRY
jgi:hypothetical protein